MAVDMFLKIDGIPGESTDDRHKDEIDILSYAWGESQPGTGMHDRVGRYLQGQDGRTSILPCVSARLRPGEIPTDQVSLRFTKIETEYTPVKPDGSLGEPIKEGGDLSTNRSA